MQPDVLPPPTPGPPSVTAASPGRGSDPAVIDIQPLYVKELAEGPELHGAIVSPDGVSIYALVETRVVDVGLLLNGQRWLFVNVAGVLAAIVLAVWIWRAARRRVEASRRFCRVCDYDLTDAAGNAQKCPECGVDLRAVAPVPGRRLLRRVVVPAGLLAAVLGVCLWYGVDGRNRFPTPFPEGRWGSRWLLGVGIDLNSQIIKNASGTGDLLLEVDASTGVTARVISERVVRTYWPMAYHRGAEAVYVEGGARGDQGIELVSVKNGRRLASLGGVTPGSQMTPFVAGHSEDGGLVYLDVFDRLVRRSSLVEWDWRAGAKREITSCPGYENWARHFIMVPGSPRRFVRYTDFMESQPMGFGVALLDADGAPLAEQLYKGQINPSAVPAFSTDGTMMFLMEQYGRAVKAFDVATLAPIGDVPTNSSTGWDKLVVRVDGRVLLVPENSGIWVRDVVDKKWVATLHHPAGSYAPRSMTFSEDGTLVAAIFQADDPSSPGRGFVSQLGVWRLPESMRLKP